MNTSQPQRKEIVVPAQGMALLAVLPALGLTFDRVNPLLGEELGAPRDYTMPAGARCVVFNIQGIRRLARLFSLDVDVIEATAPAASPVPEPAAPAPSMPEVSTDPHGRERGPHYMRGNLA